jgi:hypothetical protein
MSSPIALENKDVSKKALVSLHRTLSHSHRVMPQNQRCTSSRWCRRVVRVASTSAGAT